MSVPQTIRISRAQVETALGKPLTNKQWKAMLTAAPGRVMDELVELAREVRISGKPGISVSADSLDEGDVYLDQDGNGPYTVIEAGMSGCYMSITFRDSDGDERRDTAAMEATMTLIGGPNYEALAQESAANIARYQAWWQEVQAARQAAVERPAGASL